MTWRGFKIFFEIALIFSIGFLFVSGAMSQDLGTKDRPNGELVAWCQGDSIPFGYSDTAVYVIGPFGEAYIEDLLDQKGQLDWLSFDDQYGYLNVIGAEVVYRDEFGGSLEVTTYFSGPLQNLVAGDGEPLWVFKLQISWYNSDIGKWSTFAEYVVTPQDGAGNWLVERFCDDVPESSVAEFRALKKEGVVSITLPLKELPPNYIQTSDGVEHQVTSVKFSPYIHAKVGDFLEYEMVDAYDGAVCFVGEFEDEEASHPQRTVEIERLANLDDEDRELLDRIFSFQLYFENLTWEAYIGGLTPDQVDELIEEINQEGEGQSAQIVVASLVAIGPAKKSPIQKLIDIIEKHEKQKTLSKAKGYKKTVDKLKAIKGLYESFTSKPTGDPIDLGKNLAKALKGAVELFPTPDPTTKVVKEILKAYVEAVERLVQALMKLKFRIKQRDLIAYRGLLGGKKPSEILPAGWAIGGGKRGFLIIKKHGHAGSWPGGDAMIEYLAKVAEVKDAGKDLSAMPKVPDKVINWFKDTTRGTGLKKLTYVEKIVDGKANQKKVRFKVHAGRDPIKIFKKYRCGIDCLRKDDDESHLRKWIWEFFDPFVDLIYWGPIPYKK